MHFAYYYRAAFREDLVELLRLHKQGHGHGSDIAIQPRMLALGAKPFHTWTPDHQRLFLTALYFTVLVDQVVFTHFRGRYPRFRELTQYPKLIGDCPGGCYSHLHPAEVFSLITRGSSAPYHSEPFTCPSEFR